MTVNEFMWKVPANCGDFKITIEKHDKKQCSANTTVPISSLYLGFDWTERQVVLKPQTKLMTHADIIRERDARTIKEYSERMSKALSVALKISMMIENMEDKNLRDKIRKKLMEI